MGLAALAALMLIACADTSARGELGRLRISGRHFVDESGRVVVLRGINLAGNSKVPPFVPIHDLGALDPLPALGFNAVRLVFIWEAYEPRPGCYDLAYLSRMREIAAACGARGMYVVVDIHQDGYSRFLSYGSGDGFPAWAASPRSRLVEPDNGPRCANWPIRMALDPGMHKSFSDFYSDAHGVRSRYLEMLRTVARAFANVPGVLGYDLLNEPWGHERKELAPLYADAARVIRAEDPTAIMFLEGHVSTNTGLQTRLPRPEFDNVAYAPHYYKPPVVLTASWRGGTATIDLAFSHMNSKSASWNVPLFLGEFGAPADASNGGDYVSYLYDRLDDTFASGAQWNYTPGWNARDKDGWNNENFNILAPSGCLLPSFRLRPFPRCVAGAPCRFRFIEGKPSGASLEFSWNARPDRGETEVFLPNRVFPAGSRILIEPADASWRHDPAQQVLSIRANRAEMVTLRVVAP